MSDFTNAERQARHRAKERARVQALERELQALRNGTPEQVQQQLVQENVTLRERVQQLEQQEQVLRNGNTPPQPSSQSDLEARLEFYYWFGYYQEMRASCFKGAIEGMVEGTTGDRAKAVEYIDRLEQWLADHAADKATKVDAAYDRVEWRDDDRIDERWNRGEDDDDDGDE